MSLSPTRSGGSPARIAVASWLVSSLGDVTCMTIFRFLCVALNSGINLSAAAWVAFLIQNVTVPVALTPKVDACTFVFVSADAAGIPVMVKRHRCPEDRDKKFSITSLHGGLPSLACLAHYKVFRTDLENLFVDFL